MVLHSKIKGQQMTKIPGVGILHIEGDLPNHKGETMSVVQLSYEEKVIVERILSVGSVPDGITIDVFDYLTIADIVAIEKFVDSHGDIASKTFINNILKGSK